MKTMPSFEKTIQKTNGWIKDIMEELNLEDGQRAYQALRTVLHALRDHLSIEETAQLGAQLPMLIRGIYYEGWDPSGKPIREKDDAAGFLGYIRKYFDRDTYLDVEAVTRAVLKVLSEKISAGEISDICSSLPRDVKNFWPFSPQSIKNVAAR